MRRARLAATAAVPLAVAAAVLLAAVPAVAKPSVDLAGTWVSDGCETVDDGQGGLRYFRRVFSSTAQTWSLETSVYGDVVCTRERVLYSVTASGRYQLGRRSPTASATETRWLITRRSVTPYDQKTSDLMGLTQVCGVAQWTVGQPHDITKSGCDGLGVPACRTENDLVERTGDQLAFGARPATGDVCMPARRPRELGAALLLSPPVYALLDLPQDPSNYADAHVASMLKYGGRLVSASPPRARAAKGSWKGAAVLVQRWPSEEAFQRWWHSTDHAPLAKSLPADLRVTLVDAAPAP